MHHCIVRTSPKGLNENVVGTCTLCGLTDLPMFAMSDDCENVRGLNSDEALLELLSDNIPEPVEI